MSIAIVTDDTADIPDYLAIEYGIHIVPNVIVMDGEELKEGKDITREEYYRLLPQMKVLPTTATASPGSYQSLYQRLFSEGASHIISIHVSSLLSGIFNAASVAAQAFSGRVHVWDSQSLTLGLGFQVLAAAESVRTGTSLEGILGLLEQARPRARVYAMLDTLEYVRRSGRVSWAKARLGNLLHIKPFIEVVTGQVRSLGEVHTRSKGIERLHQLIQANAPFERLALLHTNAEGDARMLLGQLSVPVASPPLVVNVTTVIGTHVGPNGLGFACLVASS